MVIGKGSCDRTLSESEVRELMTSALSQVGLNGKRVLIIIPDSTRTAPIPMTTRSSRASTPRRKYRGSKTFFTAARWPRSSRQAGPIWSRSC